MKIMHRILRTLLVFVLLAAAGFAEKKNTVDGGDASAQSRRYSIDAQDLFELLAKICPNLLSNGWNDGLTSETRMEKQLADYGLTRAATSSPLTSFEPWTITDRTGTISVNAIFMEDNVNFYLRFFPPNHDSIPEPILKSLLSKAIYSSLGKGNVMELQFSVEDCGVVSDGSYAVSETGYMNIKLQNGVLISQSKIIKCVKSAK